MLDHVFADALGALRDAIELARLERQAIEERFQSDILLGDMTWHTSYGLPGEGNPPKVQADITCLWPTWSQAAYRSWYIEEEFTEPPAIDVEITFRRQGLAQIPDPSVLLATLPATSEPIGQHSLERTGPTVESIYQDNLERPEFAIEVSYLGSYELDEDRLVDGARLDADFGQLGGWIAATLVQLGDCYNEAA